MTKHLKALAHSKNFIKLHEPDPAFMEELKRREEEADKDEGTEKFKKL